MSPSKSKSGQNEGNPERESSDPSREKKNQESQEEIPWGEKLPGGECGFCLFMKGGGCRELFIEWDKCVEKGQKEDNVGKCFKLATALMKCMEKHSDYYAPILQAVKEWKREKVNESNSWSAASTITSSKTVGGSESS